MRFGFESKITETSDPDKNAINALWIIEACYDTDEGEAVTTQGSAFQLKGVGIVTCSHVVSEEGKVFEELKAFKHDDPSVKYRIRVERICPHKDVAVCSLLLEDDRPPPENCVQKSEKPVEMRQEVKLLGFPAYAPGHGFFLVDAKVAKIYTQSLVSKFEIDALIREGNSGGPIIDSESNVVGIALEGARKDAGNNGCLAISEIDEVLSDEKYKI